jgi:hypothetical protein
MHGNKENKPCSIRHKISFGMGAKIPQMDIARRLTKIYRKNILDAPPGQDCSLKKQTPWGGFWSPIS